MELTQEEIQELDQHDIERIWPSDEDVATAASTRINREWNPFLSRSHRLTEQPEPETPTGSDDGGAISESQSAFLSSDGVGIPDILSTTAEATSCDNEERSHGQPSIKPLHRNPPAAAAAAPSGGKSGEALRGERKEAMYGGFSVANNLLDSATVDSSLMNSVLDTGGSGRAGAGGAREPLWGNTLGFGFLPQTGSTHHHHQELLTQPLRPGTTNNNNTRGVLRVEDLPPPIHDPAIMHMMPHPPAASAMPVVHEEEGGFVLQHDSYSIQQENPSAPKVVATSDEYDSHYNQGPFVPFHPDSFQAHFNLGNVGAMPDRLSAGSSRASTPQQQQLQQQQHFILQQHRDSVDSTTSDMRVAESSSRPGSRGSGVVLQGGRRPRCCPTTDVVPPAPGRMPGQQGDVMAAAPGTMRGQPGEGSGSSSESESEAEYEDASDVWDTGSSVVSDKQYTEIEPREYHQHQGAPRDGEDGGGPGDDSQQEEDSEEYSSSDVDADVGSGSGSGDGAGSSEYDVEDPDSARSTQNTPVGDHPYPSPTGAGDPGVPLERPAGFSSPVPGRSDVTTPVNKSGVQVNAVKPTVQPPPTSLPPEGGGHWPANQGDAGYPGGVPQKQPPSTDFAHYFHAYGNPMQYGMQPWMMNMGMPFGMGMPPNMGMMAAAQMMQQQAQQQQQQQSLKQQQMHQHPAGGDQCTQSSDSQTTCQETVSSVPPPCMGSIPPSVPAPPPMGPIPPGVPAPPPMGPIPGMQQMPPNPMAAMPNMQQMPNPMTSQGMPGMPVVGGDPMAPFGMGNPVGVGVPAPPMPPPPPFMPNFMSMMMMNPQMMPSFGMPLGGGGGMMNPAQMAPGGVPGTQPPSGSTGHTTDINANDTKEQGNNAKILHDSWLRWRQRQRWTQREKNWREKNRQSNTVKPGFNAHLPYAVN